MLYASTRGGAADRGFADVLIEGLAPDGGLYVPQSLPTLPALPDDFAGAVAAFVSEFVEPDPLAADLPGDAADVYGRFRHPEVAPIRPMGGDLHLLELFWGPTLSFKDYALQLVGAMFDRVLARRQERLVILGATSGDTGSAAIEACRGRGGVDVVVLFPHGAISDVQRRQMTTVPDANVHVVAVDGTFDDCQRLVKEAFVSLGERFPLAAFNSINWARIAAQAGYYAYAANQFAEPTRFVVPTGNFGNILSAHLARRMGAPIAGLTVANNVNHGLTDLITTGHLAVSPTATSHAPAMDVQVPSNLERYLYEVLGENPDRVSALQAEFARTGRIDLPAEARTAIASDFEAAWRPDTDIVDTIRRTHDQTGVVLDPHTAVAWSVATESSPREPTVVVATAHPAKFPEVVQSATGLTPQLPDHLAEQLSAPERLERMRPDLARLADLLERVTG